MHFLTSVLRLRHFKKYLDWYFISLSFNSRSLSSCPLLFCIQKIQNQHNTELRTLCLYNGHFINEIIIITGPQLDNVQKVRGLRALGPKGDIFRKGHKSKGSWMSSRKQYLPDTTDWCMHDLTDTLALCARSAQVQTRQGASTEEEKWRWALTPNQKAKKKISFLHWGVTGFANHALRQIPFPRVVSQQKNKLCHSCGRFVSFRFVWALLPY